MCTATRHPVFAGVDIAVNMGRKTPRQRNAREPGSPKFITQPRALNNQLARERCQSEPFHQQIAVGPLDCRRATIREVHGANARDHLRRSTSSRDGHALPCPGHAQQPPPQHVADRPVTAHDPKRPARGAPLRPAMKSLEDLRQLVKARPQDAPIETVEDTDRS